MAHKAEIRRQINPVMYWFKMINEVLPARIQFFLGLTTGVDLVFDLNSNKYRRGTSFFVEINRTSTRLYFGNLYITLHILYISNESTGKCTKFGLVT